MVQQPFMQTVLSVQDHCFIDGAWTVVAESLNVSFLDEAEASPHHHNRRVEPTQTWDERWPNNRHPRQTR